MKTGKTQARQMHPQLKKLDNKLKEASKMYENQFLRHMVKAMRNSVSHSGMTKPGMAESIYREQLDDKHVDSWVERGGTGFADLIYNDLVEKFYPQLGNRKVKKIRPMNLSDRYQGVSKALAKNTKSQTYNIQLGPQQESKSYLKLPWKGTFEKEFDLGDGKKVAMFSHPSGLKSTFVFQGKLEPGLLNKTLLEGENFARLGPESQSLTWKVQDANSRKDPAEGKKNSFN